MATDLVLKVGGRQLTGWAGVAVTRSIEQIPNTFEIEATEASPAYSDAAMVQAGQACTVSLGADTVLTGYVDTVSSGYSVGQHTVRIQGRGKCQDLVDCSAEWPNGQISGANAFEIAQKLAAPYGITVKNLTDPGKPVPQFNLNFGETVTDILELICRHAAVLYYEDAQGNLVLDDAGGSLPVIGGFVEGQNVQAATALRSKAQRYSEYTCSLLAVNTLGVFDGKSLPTNDGLFFYTAKDPAVGRNRKLYIVAEGVQGGLKLAENRALWEAARRAGRGEQVNLTADSWRDSKGKLWAPNTLAAVHLPRLGIKHAQLCIAEVTYRFSAGQGRTADVRLMRRESFLPQPIQLQPIVLGLTPTGGA